MKRRCVEEKASAESREWPLRLSHNVMRACFLGCKAKPFAHRPCVLVRLVFCAFAKTLPRLRTWRVQVSGMAAGMSK